MKEDLMDSDFKQVSQDEIGTVYADWEEEDYRCLIMRGTSSLCGYIGVKKNNILYGVNHNDLDIQCHFGLTFSEQGMGEAYPKGYWWFGWDYAHFTDRKLDDDYPHHNAIAWTPKWVKTEFPEILDSFRETTKEFLAGREYADHIRRN